MLRTVVLGPIDQHSALALEFINSATMRPYRPVRHIVSYVLTSQLALASGPGSLTQDFGENEDENHAHEQPRLLSRASNTSVTDDTDSKSGWISYASTQ
jgi:hypothetical protein